MLGFEPENQNIFPINNYIGYWKKLKSIRIKSREYATWTYVDGCLVLFGGLNYEKMNEVSIFDFRTK